MARSGINKGESAKRIAGNAKKAAVAAEKAAAEEARQAAIDEAKWRQGAKPTAKKEAEASKREELARKKAERDAQLEQEEAGARNKPKNNPRAVGKSGGRGLNLDMLDASGASTPTGRGKASTLNASGIDNALDALSLNDAPASAGRVERHPERRYPAALRAFMERRLPELEDEMPGLRHNQRIVVAEKEFKRSPDNPFNQMSVRYDASKEEILQARSEQRAALETRLTTA